MTDQIARHLRTEELYDLITENIAYSEDPATGFHSSTQVRRVLDQILSQGKIEARLTALSQRHRLPLRGEVWGHRDRPHDLVMVDSTGPDECGPRVFYHHTSPDDCSCKHADKGPHAQSGHRSNAMYWEFFVWYRPVELNDRLIEDWQEIVDGVAR